MKKVWTSIKRHTACTDETFLLDLIEVQKWKLHNFLNIYNLCWSSQDSNFHNWWKVIADVQRVIYSWLTSFYQQQENISLISSRNFEVFASEFLYNIEPNFPLYYIVMSLADLNNWPHNSERINPFITNSVWLKTWTCLLNICM